MLEIRNLSKTYAIKHGVPVKALDNVSLNIEDKGMVFVLGKSGCGKSTFLNLLGGLDKYDEGEIKIYGKSTKDFTQADFDSYRNTFIGFIFQEYNILDELTVGQNLALAIQLQGKKPTDEMLYDILREVDLEDYATRRPNELSGGQLQRVAVARALIKNPEVIMADEPTGALDSKTGIQIFDTLKKISNYKLVIVVSHDREFAEQYADRIIEFKDGRIISDVKKHIVSKDSISKEKPKALSIDDDNKLHIKKGFKLTAKDYQLINFYVEKSDEDYAEIIYDDAQEASESRVDEKGNVLVFKKIESTQPLTNSNKELTRVKSALPFKNSLKMGANSLKIKLFRLLLTIFLSTVAFTMFGLVATFADFKEYTAMANTIIDNQIDYINVQQKIPDTQAGYYNNTTIRQSDMQNLLQLNPNVNFLKVYSGTYSNSFYIENMKFSKVYYRNGALSGITEINMPKEKLFSAYGFSVVGELPTADDEIAITKYFFEHFKISGVEGKSISSETDLIGERIVTSFGVFKVAGIVDTKLDGEYDKLKEVTNAQASTIIEDKDLANTISLFRSETRYGFHSLVFVNNGYIEKNFTDNKYVINKDNITLSLVDSELVSETNTTGNFILEDGFLATVGISTNSKFFFDKDKTTLENNEILLPYGALSLTIRKEISENVDQRIIDYCLDIENVPTAIREMGKDELNGILNPYDYNGYCESDPPTDYDYSIAYYSWLKNCGDDTYGDRFALISQIAQEEMTNAVAKHSFDISLFLARQDNETVKEVKIAGFLLTQKTYYTSSFECFSLNTDVLMTDNLMQELGLETCGIYNSFVGNIPSSKKEIYDLTKAIYTYNQNGDNYIILNNITDEVTEISEALSNWTDILLYVAIGLAAFAMVLIMNYISTSISHKKKEIGVLRALGARGIDVFGIFFNEAMILALINFALSVAATAFTVLGLNMFLRNEMFMNITVFHFGILQVLFLLGASVVSAILASFLPVFHIARKRPIDAIRNK